jgi:hypothetical protein
MTIDEMQHFNAALEASNRACSLVAHRAIGALIALRDCGLIPSCHAEQIENILAAYAAADSVRSALMAPTEPTT